MVLKNISRVRGIFHGSQGYSTGPKLLPRIPGIFHGSQGYSTAPTSIPRVTAGFNGPEGYFTGPQWYATVPYNTPWVWRIFHGSKGYSTAPYDTLWVWRLFHWSKGYSTGHRDMPNRILHGPVELSTSHGGIFHGSEKYLRGLKNIPRFHRIFHWSEGYFSGPKNIQRVRKHSTCYSDILRFNRIFNGSKGYFRVLRNFLGPRNSQRNIRRGTIIYDGSDEYLKFQGSLKYFTGQKDTPNVKEIFRESLEGLWDYYEDLRDIPKVHRRFHASNGYFTVPRDKLQI